MFIDGYVFICTEATAKGCFGMNLFGGPDRMWEDISKISDKTAIFLLRKTGRGKSIMYGVFLANGLPRCNIKPNVWGGKYPAQVRVKQYYQFCSIPWGSFKNIFARNRGCTLGLRITKEQTLDLVTKFIINTRVFLSHRVVAMLSDEIRKNNDQVWMEEKRIGLKFPMDWWIQLMIKGGVEFRFSPKHMLAGGSIMDFVLAIRSRSIEKCAQESTNYFKKDWKKLLEILHQIMVHSSFTNRMEEITSVLTRVCMPIGSYLIKSASQDADADMRKKWLRSSASKNEDVPIATYLPPANRLYDKSKPCNLGTTMKPVSDLVQPNGGYISPSQYSSWQSEKVSNSSPSRHMPVFSQDRSIVQTAQKSTFPTSGSVKRYHAMALKPYNRGSPMPGCVTHYTPAFTQSAHSNLVLPKGDRYHTLH